MVTVSCDVCKKKIDNPITDRTLFYYDKHLVCESCKDSFEFNIRTDVRAVNPFIMDRYRKLMRDSLDKAVQKGRA
ncbi:MAG: hypothetical protein LBI28_11435 [Treponema sp.]|jgi:hypothetical protein|nr:hypothetical protein [Treponema sp.]